MPQKNKIFVSLILLCGFLVFLWLIIYVLNPYVTWKEEVKLNDWRVIVVEQKKRMARQIDRESWLTIHLPEISSHPIVWHESLSPLVVNIYGGRLFVVGWPPTGIEKERYGNQKPPYIGYVWENGAFVRIPFEKIPEKIYDTNMLIDAIPPNNASFVDIQTKDNLRIAIPPYALFYQRIDPTIGCLCQRPNPN